MRMAEQDAAGVALCERYAVADVDSHIIEPADLWTSRVSLASGATSCPTCSSTNGRQEDGWYIGDQEAVRRRRLRPGRLAGVPALASSRL